MVPGTGRATAEATGGPGCGGEEEGGGYPNTEGVGREGEGEITKGEGGIRCGWGEERGRRGMEGWEGREVGEGYRRAGKGENVAVICFVNIFLFTGISIV